MPSARQRESERRVDLALSALVWLGTIVVLFWPLLRGAVLGDPRFFDWDVPEQYWPDLVRLCRDLHGDGVPYWSPHDRGGYPYYADPQAAPFHPVNWAICAAAGPSPSIHWASFRVLLGFLITAVGTHAWLRRTSVGRRGSAPSPTASEGPRRSLAPLPHAACALGACVAASAPFLRHNWELNLTFAFAWLPWILLGIDALRASATLPRAAALALAFGMCAWSGSPPALWLTCTFSLAYASCLVVADRASGNTSPVPSRDGLPALSPAGGSIAAWTLAVLLTCLLVAVVVIPGQALSARSVQADHTLASLAAGGITRAGLLAVVTPLPGNHLFLGPVVWLGVGAALSSRRTRVAALGCLAISALAVVLAMGEHGPVFRVFFDLVPGFDRFRLPHRYEAWLGPAAALATALGTDVLAREVGRARAPRTERVIAWVLALGLSAAHVSLVSTHLDPERHTRGGPVPCRSHSDLLYARIAGSPERVFDEFALGCRSGTRLGHEDLRGYQDPLMLHSYERVLSRLAERPGLLRQFGVRYALTSPHFLHGWDHHYLPRPEILASLPGARTVYADGARRVIDLGEPVPRAYLVPEAEVISVGSREEALEIVAVRAPRRMAVVEVVAAHDPPLTLAGEGGGDGQVDAVDGTRSGIDAPVGVPIVTHASPDEIRVSFQGSATGILVLSDVYDVGWTATVDGEARQVLRVNALVRGVRVEGGPGEPREHTAVFRYAPADGRITRVLWGLGWMLCLLCIALPARARRRPR